MAQSGPSVNAFVKKARNHLKAKNFVGAHSVLRDGLAVFPENSKLLHLAGRTAYHLGYYRAAAPRQSTLAVTPQVEVYGDLGLVHRAHGNLGDSATGLRTAILHDPKLYRTHVNRGLALRAQDDLIGALEAFYAAFKLDPEGLDAILGLGTILGRVTTEEHNPLIDQMLVDVLEATGANYQALAPAAADQLIKKYGVEDNGLSARDLDPGDPLLRLYLTKCLNIVPALEYALARHRRNLLFSAPEGLGVNASGMAVLIALQCFNNEYVFFSEPDENSAVSETQRRIESALASGELPEGFDADVLVLTMYQPLSAIAGAEDHVDVFEANGASDFLDVVQVTLKDNMEEQALKSTIGTFSQIEDRTSRDVRRQYEEHPYPRWIHVPHVRPVNLALQLKTKFPHFSPPQFLEDPKTILVAGCGTGRHVANVALQWPRADILAIDLSTASMAYAMRKMKELHIKNVRFLHGDILQAAKLGGPFDMVQSTGVLHHMKEPLEGWRILSGLIRDGGVFKGGLYSKRGRQGVFAARRAIAKEGIAGNRADMADFRRRILLGDVPGDFSQLIEFADFYSTSTCRDLMFHVHEDHYTPLRLKAEIEDVGLVFLGFNELEERGVNAEYRQRFPDDPSLTNLKNWDDYEKTKEDPPEGYDFWCWKPG